MSYNYDSYNHGMNAFGEFPAYRTGRHMFYLKK
jgi:hypothetical protein